MRLASTVLLLLALAAAESGCKTSCAAQDARPFHGPASCCGGPLDDPLGEGQPPFVWNGRTCRPLFSRCGCNTCNGSDCGDLYPSYEACAAAHGHCGEEPSAGGPTGGEAPGTLVALEIAP